VGQRHAPVEVVRPQQGHRRCAGLGSWWHVLVSIQKGLPTNSLEALFFFIRCFPEFLYE
jgi:hypothetical protein